MDVLGLASTQTVTFLSIIYLVTFGEAGLNTGTAWAVTLGGIQNSSTAPSIGFREPNGTGYTFQVGAVARYTASPSAGTISVVGVSVTQSILFTSNSGPLAVRAWAAVTYRGGGGSYCIDGTGEVGTHPAWENLSLTAVAWNGTSPYNYTWWFGPGTPDLYGPRVNYTLTQYETARVILTVKDQGMAENVTPLSIGFFAPPGAPPVCPRNSSGPPTVLGLPVLEGYALIAGLAVAVVATTAAVVVWKRRKGRGPLESR